MYFTPPPVGTTFFPEVPGDECQNLEQTHMQTSVRIGVAAVGTTQKSSPSVLHDLHGKARLA